MIQLLINAQSFTAIFTDRPTRSNMGDQIDGLVHVCSIIAQAPEILQSCTKSSKYMLIAEKVMDVFNYRSYDLR